MRLLILILLLTATTVNATTTITTDIDIIKKVNGNAGVNLSVDIKKSFTDKFDLYVGFSENYTAHRSSIYRQNHCGRQFTIGVFWYLPLGFQLGYTHSNRRWFEGANPRDLFINDDVDIVTIRKEVKF